MTYHIPEFPLHLGIEGNDFFERHDGKAACGAQPFPLGRAGLLSRLEHQDKGILVLLFLALYSSGSPLYLCSFSFLILKMGMIVFHGAGLRVWKAGSASETPDT